MPLVFQTPEGGQAVEIPGVGVCGPDGQGGRLVSDAAEVLHELQDRNGDPLTGNALKKHAREFADARDLVVNDLSEPKVAELPAQMGAAPDRPPAAEVAVMANEALYGNLDPAIAAHNKAIEASETGQVDAADVARAAGELQDAQAIEQASTPSPPDQTVAPTE